MMRILASTQATFMFEGTLTIDQCAPTPRTFVTGAAPPASGRTRLRALQVINGEHYAGAERVQDLLAERLPEMGVDIGFACLKPGRFPALRQARHAPLVEMPMKSRIDLRPAFRLANLVQKQQYHLLHTHSARALLVARFAAALCGVPIVHHVHGHTSSEVSGRRFTRLNAWAERRSLSAARAVIAVSQSVRDYLLAANVRADRVFVVSNGVATRCRLQPRPEGPKCTLGFIALLRQRKGLEDFLEAAAILQTQGEQLRLRIVGRFETMEYEHEVRRHAARLGLDDTIDWRGFQQRVDLELDQMDLLVFPSILPEGMPMVVLESMAAGVPIAATRVSGITDVLRDGEDALLVPPGRPADLARTVKRLMDDPALAERLRQSALDRQREHFSDRSMASSVAQIYENVLKFKEVAS